MTQPKDGGKAFAQHGNARANHIGHPDWTIEIFGGMSMRDYFAAKALEGCATSAGYQGLPWDQVAVECYKAADAMIAERAK